MHGREETKNDQERRGKRENGKGKEIAKFRWAKVNEKGYSALAIVTSLFLAAIVTSAGLLRN